MPEIVRELLTEPKNLERIEAVRTNQVAEITVRVSNPLIRRWFVRDFYFVTGRLFINARGMRTRERVAQELPALMKDLQYAVTGLMTDADAYSGALSEDLPVHEFRIKLVSPTAATICKELMRADPAAARLYVSADHKDITLDQRDEFIKPVLLALQFLKQLAMNHVPKTAAELAEELQIS